MNLEATIRRALTGAGIPESPRGSTTTGFRIWMRNPEDAKVVQANPIQPTDAGMQCLYTCWEGTIKSALGDDWHVAGYDDGVLIRARASM